MAHTWTSPGHCDSTVWYRWYTLVDSINFLQHTQTALSRMELSYKNDTKNMIQPLVLQTYSQDDTLKKQYLLYETWKHRWHSTEILWDNRLLSASFAWWSCCLEMVGWQIIMMLTLVRNLSLVCQSQDMIQCSASTTYNFLKFPIITTCWVTPDTCMSLHHVTGSQPIRSKWSRVQPMGVLNITS